MTREDIIRMARECGYWSGQTVEMNDVGLEHFATLVAAASEAKEREACAKVCEELPAPDIYSDTDKSMWDVACMDCATAIRERSANARARGQT